MFFAKLRNPQGQDKDTNKSPAVNKNYVSIFADKKKKQQNSQLPKPQKQLLQQQRHDDVKIKTIRKKQVPSQRPTPPSSSRGSSSRSSSPLKRNTPENEKRRVSMKRRRVDNIKRRSVSKSSSISPPTSPRKSKSFDYDDTSESMNRSKVLEDLEPKEKRDYLIEALKDDNKTSFEISIIHANDLFEGDIPQGYENYFTDMDSIITVELQSIASDTKEKYPLISPTSKSQEQFDPVAEISRIMIMVANYFISDDDLKTKIYDSEMGDCIVRRLKRAVKNDDSNAFINAVDQYNELIKELKENGSFIEHIKNLKELSDEFIKEILTQVYSRAVSPRIRELRDYKAFSNNVYGELLPNFVHDLFQETSITQSSVFIDLGSGVGNCVIQSALEVGCESWGIEMMPVASELSSLQKKEMENRIKMYGIKIGEINTISGSFVSNPQIQNVLKRADFVLCNNYAFDAELNGHLVDMFLDLRDGTKIISLKSFVPVGHSLNEHNIESPLNLLNVVEKEFYEGCVSWTNAPGKYYVSTIDRSKIQKFLAKRNRSSRRRKE